MKIFLQCIFPLVFLHIVYLVQFCYSEMCDLWFFFILRGHIKRFPISDNNLFCNCWSKKNSYRLFTWQHNHTNLKAEVVPKNVTPLCTWWFALYFSIIYTLALQEVCFISGNETSLCYLNGWPVQFIWRDILYNLKEKKKLEWII